ncbi:MAG: prolyl oligopeptidase family serine peptidase [Pseudomonadota bacterium]
MTTLPYGSWPSPLAADALVEGVVGLSSLQAQGGYLYWLEARPEEGGRSTLVRLDPRAPDAVAEELTPAPYNVRSRVHEYGGGAYRAHDAGVFFVNFADQNLYRIGSDGTVAQLTEGDSQERFADFAVDAERERLLCICERHHEDGSVENSLVSVAWTDGRTADVARGHDFYAAPRLSANGGRLAFVAWDHPNMPWDGTTLYVTDLDAEGMPTELMTLAGGAQESVQQPLWLADDSLVYLSDANGFWNLYRFDDSGSYVVLEDGADYGGPPWGLDTRSYADAGADHLIAVRQGPSAQEFVLVNARNTMASPLQPDPAPWCGFDSPCVIGGDLYFIGRYPHRSPSIERLPLRGGQAVTLKAAGGPALNDADVSWAEALSFPTRDGAEAYGYFYAPKRAAIEGPEDERPPLVVMSHGGPTAAASPAFSLLTQYYTTRGWAVLDVNYRGSTGYGRSYRKALDGHWGLLDVSDCEDGVRHLAGARRIDPDRVAIRGGSAGGYTTLAALTTTGTFRAGASHYGIGDLHALARDTHKFESRYLDNLLGNDEALAERSPINHLDGLRCPVIFFQGSEDRVVPPNQSQAMASALRERDIPTAYLEFQGEGHGFRDGRNIVRAVRSEVSFFSRVFHIEAADPHPDLSIDNADKL